MADLQHPSRKGGASEWGWPEEVDFSKVRRIARLGASGRFPKGDIGEERLRKLLVLTFRTVGPPMNGCQPCALCPENRDPNQLLDYPERQKVEFDGRVTLLGSAEIWVPASGGRIYRATDLIYHYVTEHGYRPPKGFLEALDEWDEDRDPPVRVDLLPFATQP